MRRLTHLLLLIIVLTIVLGSGAFYWVKFSQRDNRDPKTLDDRFSRRTVYSLETNKWLEFPVAGFHDRLRLSSFALIQGERDQFASDREFLYAITYQILDENSNILLEKKYHMRSFFPDVIIDKDSQTLEPKFLPKQTAIITAGRFFDIDLATLKQPRKVRLKVSAQEAQIEKILVRALFRGRLSAAKARLRWGRLSEEKKLKVTRPYIYPHSLLSSPEIESRLSQRWYPTAPSDTVYESQILYSYRTDNDEVVYEDTPLRIGRSFGAELRLSALIPKSTTYRLFFQAANHNISSPVPVVLRHWNPGPRIATEETIYFDPANPIIERHFDKGMIELYADHLLRVSITSEQVDSSHINKVYVLSAYALDNDTPVIYDLTANAREATDFRVSIRTALGYSGLSKTQATMEDSLFSATPNTQHAGTQTDTSPRYEILSENNQVLFRGALEVNPLLSPYGQLVGHNARYNISDSQSLYLPVPPHAARIALYGSPRLFAYAYTRPNTLPLTRVIPKDYRTWEHLGGRAPAWFLLTPANDLELALDGRRNRLYSQPKPPAVDEQINAGFFSVREIQPVGDVWGKYIIASLAYDKQPRVGADKLFFTPLKQTSAVTLTAPPGIDTVAPSLLFQRSTEAPETVTVSLDGKLVDDYKIRGKAGFIRLPPVSKGAHSIRIDDRNGALWYINQCDCRYTHQRRFAYKFVDGSIEFEIQKTSMEDEVLTLLVYTRSQGESADISTEIIGFSRAETPSKGWSFKRINFKVRPDNDSPGGFELDFNGKPVGNPERLFINLGADIPPGKYRLRVRQTGGAEALVQLYKLEATSGVSRFFSELL